MSKGKTSTIKEVTYGSRDYYLGLDYLTRNHPDNSHLKSCYEGVSFRNLARCVMFDKGNGILKLDGYLKRPQRFVLISTSGEIAGVMVTASMPEFYQEIEYEDYAVIDTETAVSYDQFLGSLSFTGKAEIVTFNDKQVRLVKSRFAVKKIHNWSVFAYRGGMISGVPADIKLMDAADLGLAKRLSKGLPEESSPFRSLQFQLKGFPYKNYILSFNGGVSVFVGVCPYGTGVCQLNYLVGSQANNELLLVAIETIGRSVQSSGCELIWRLRRNDVLKNRTLIVRSGLVELIKERHLHLM